MRTLVLVVQQTLCLANHSSFRSRSRYRSGQDGQALQALFSGRREYHSVSYVRLVLLGVLHADLERRL